MDKILGSLILVNMTKLAAMLKKRVIDTVREETEKGVRKN